jgi:hypothetical protein
LLENIFDVAIPNLAAFPGDQHQLSESRSGLTSGKLKLADLRGRLGKGAELRELILGDYLILYAVREDVLYLLAIKHHLQLSCDFRGHWVS